jgi:lysophospholipase L1-like esterase
LEKMTSNPLSYLALGDSNTIGERVAHAERWPVQLAAALHAAGVHVCEPQIVAQTGWTTDELSAAIEAGPISDTFDIVSLLIGVNNQFRGRSLSEYRDQFCHLLAQAIRFANGLAARVIVLSIPDWGVMPFAEGRDRAKIATEIDQFNAVAQYEAARLGVSWVDVTCISRDLQPGWAADDGLHPSGAQYAAWVASALPTVRKALAR